MVDLPDDGWIRSDLAAASPHALFGDPQEMIETIQERRERWGLTYFVCFDNDVDAFIPVVRQLAV